MDNKYEILDTIDSDIFEAIKRLEKKVTDEINKGWKPQGGISMLHTKVNSQYGIMYILSQAMIKEE